MNELLISIINRLVDHPEDVRVEERAGDYQTVLELHVNQADMGKVIGKQGRIAKAIRTVMKAAAVKSNQRIIVEIADDARE